MGFVEDYPHNGTVCDKAGVGERRPRVPKQECLRLGVAAEHVIRDHDHELYGRGAGATFIISIAPYEVLDPEGACLLRELATEGSVWGDGNGDPTAFNEEGPKDCN